LLVWKRLLAARGLAGDGLAERVAAEYGRLRRVHGVRPYDGVPALLEDLRAAGYGLGLLTNGLSDAQWDKIRSTGLAPRFAAVLVAGDVGLYKPDPQAFEALLGRLGAPRERALFVGDSYEMDVVGAAAAGIACAWVRADGAPLPGPIVPQIQLSSVLGVREVAL
jgi:HAD superfamily hydrolase (TIGR01549 family)